MGQPLNIVFAGAPEFAAAHLQALLDSHHRVVAVYTQPDRPSGRGRKVTKTAVKELAERHDLPVFQPESLKGDEAVAQLAELKADVMVVVAYGLLLPKAILETPKLGCVNVHGSILPKWRGAAPIQRAVEAGDERVGVTIMQMDVGLDTGDMLKIADSPLDPSWTTVQLHDHLIKLGCPALIETLDDMSLGQHQGIVQDHDQATYAHKMTKQEGLMDWQHDAKALVRRIKAFNPWPVCHTQLADQTLRIWNAEWHDDGQGEPGTLEVQDQHILVQCGQGRMRLTELQLPGGKMLTVQQILQSKAELFRSVAKLG